MSFHVSLQPSGREFWVARDEAILAAAIRQGIGMPYGCRDGACGSCKSRLHSGRVIHGAHQHKALSLAEEAGGWVLPCCAMPQTDCVVEARGVTGVGDFAVLKMPTRVVSISRRSADVVAIKLQLPGNQNFQYRPGQYIDFILAGGMRRSYSMANAPHNMGHPPAIELHIRHMPGGRFTDQVFATLKEKDILRVEGPFGSFCLREGSDKPIILLASGTGLAPIKAIIEHMQAKPIARPVTLYWGCRSRADLYLDDWARALPEQLPGLHYLPVLSEPRQSDEWTGRVGLVHRAVMADFSDLSGHEVYACGVPAMVDAAQRDFGGLCGLPPEAFFSDAFISEADKHGN